LSATSNFASILRKYHPEIVHLHFVGFIGILPWVARLMSVKQILFTDQGSHPEGYTPHRAALWKRLLVRLVNWPLTKVICVSNYNHRCMTTRDLLPSDRIEQIYNSVDFSRVSKSAERADQFRQRYSIPKNRKMITQVSWIIPEKGIPDLLEALRFVLQEQPDVQLVLVGDGRYFEKYQMLAAEMGLGDHVTWAGLVQDPFAEGVYDAADVVCQVSRWEEAFGWTIAEAMACRKPVIGTRVGGIPELIEDGKTGFVVPPGAPNEIAEKILRVLADGDLSRRMGQAGRYSAIRKFDLQKNVIRLVEFYELSLKR
jgi:glycosyltransferase involved in cell wall biosynthesis